MLDGNARQNLATFCQTWEEPEVLGLMTLSINKDMIDRDEYPQAAEIERRCVHMMADLWNAPSSANTVGTSAIGCSEACMLAGRRPSGGGGPSAEPKASRRTGRTWTPSPGRCGGAGSPPACRETLRAWLERFAGRDEVTFAVEGCTGWRFVAEEMQRAGVTALLAEPAETADRRGPKRRLPV